jgi:predicted nucleic acid-binding protein
MKSLDTNLLVYAATHSAPEHARALVVIDEMLSRPQDWILSDQVLWEYYKALRHPRILEKPRSAKEAARQVRFLRESSGVAFCSYEGACYANLIMRLEKRDFPYQRTHDAVLAATLRHHGVKEFFTRNTKDFVGSGFTKVINPID